MTAASIDAALATSGVKDGWPAANITFTGTAAGGDLQFFAADGSNISVTEAVSGIVTGGIGQASRRRQHRLEHHRDGRRDAELGGWQPDSTSAAAIRPRPA